MFNRKQIEFNFFKENNNKKEKKIMSPVAKTLHSVILLFIFSQGSMLYEMAHDINQGQQNNIKSINQIFQDYSQLGHYLDNKNSEQVFKSFTALLAKDDPIGYQLAGAQLQALILAQERQHENKNINLKQVDSKTLDKMVQYYITSWEAKKIAGFNSTNYMANAFECNAFNFSCKLLNNINFNGRGTLSEQYKAMEQYKIQKIEAINYNLTHQKEYKAWYDNFIKQQGTQRVIYQRSPGDVFVEAQK